jgi:hypothetical protein
MTRQARAVIIISGDAADLHQAIPEMCEIADGYGQSVDLIIDDGDE